MILTYNFLRWLKKQQFICQISETEKSKIKVPANLVTDDIPLPVLQISALLLFFIYISMDLGEERVREGETQKERELCSSTRPPKPMGSRPYFYSLL